MRNIYLLSILLTQICLGTTTEMREVTAVRLQGDNINIDGQLTELIWQSSLIYPEFIQRDPLEGESATEKTAFAVAYDDKFLYVGIMAFTNDVSSIRKILSRRDEDTPSDWLYVSIDSYNDNRTAFEFGLNASGVKRDLRRYDDDYADDNWDAIWEGKASVNQEGWSAEFKIPLRELRFDEGSEQTWGLQINRYIAKNNEDDYWTYWSKDESGWVRHYGDLKGLSNIPKQDRLQVSPYLTGSYDRDESYVNPTHADKFKLLSTAGADIRYGVTNNLTLDVSLNPDFGQVEADPAELNISGFETYFSERRPFFMEGGNIFNFSLGFGDGDQSSNTLFYTRRIGRAPHDRAGSVDSLYYSTNPSATKILGAAKLSGKTSTGLSIGVLEAVTAKEQATTKYMDGSEEKYTVEPLTNYFVTRLQKDYREGKTTIGGIITSTNRKLDEEHLNRLHKDAYSGGIDFTHLFKDDEYMLLGTLSATHILGDTTAIQRTQLSPIHYFQRTDAGHLSYNPGATNLSGYAHTFAFLKIKGDFRGAIGEWTYSPGFEANDLGYNRDVDSKVRFIWLSYRDNDPGVIIRNFQINHNIWQSETFGGERLALGGNINGNMTFINYWRLNAGLNVEAPSYNRTVLWGGPKVKSDPRLNFWFFAGNDNRKKVNIAFNGWAGFNTSNSYRRGLWADLEWRATDYLSMVISGSVNTTHDTWASWYGYRPLPNIQTGEESYILATMDQNTVSSTLRFDYTISPNLTLQFYGSPFITAGRYYSFKDLVDFNADKFEDRIKPYSEDQMTYVDSNSVWLIDSDNDGITNYQIPNQDFNYKAFNSNLVLRWEYNPGSILYLVWARGLSDYTPDGTFSVIKDFRALMGNLANDIFLIKFNYLFNL